MDWTRWGQREELSEAELREREAAGTRGMWRGLFWVGIIVLLFALGRAGLGRAFVQGWWRQW